MKDDLKVEQYLLLLQEQKEFLQSLVHWTHEN